jgi:hypothetical protein
MNAWPSHKNLQAHWESVKVLEEDKLLGPARAATISEAANTLFALWQATGDPDFLIGIRAMQRHRFHEKKGPGKLTPLHEKNDEIVLLRQMDDLIGRHGRKPYYAAAWVAATFTVPGKSFAAAIKRLTAAYREADRQRDAAERGEEAG